MPLKSKNTVSITLTFDRTCRAFFGLGEPECLHWDDWDLVPTSFHTLCYTSFHFLRKIWYKSFDPILLTNENHQAHKNPSNLSGCHRQSKQWIQLKILSYFRGMYTKRIKKNLTIGLSKPEKLKNFRYFLNTPRIGVRWGEVRTVRDIVIHYGRTSQPSFRNISWVSCAVCGLASSSSRITRFFKSPRRLVRVADFTLFSRILL